jgi:type I restriction enzyme S subunit
MPDFVTNRPFGSGMRFVNGDTLVARITPCLENGKTAYVDFLEGNEVGWGSTEYIVLRPKPPLPKEFAYCLARSDAFREFAIQSMTGSSGRQRVPAESLWHLLLPVPPHEIAKCFGAFIRPLFTRASASVRESRILAAIRDTLLPKLISGELRVKDAERFADHGVGESARAQRAGRKRSP